VIGEIVRVGPDDADALTRIAFAAKSYWGYPERWIEQWQEALTITPGFISDNEVYAAVSEEEMGSFYALVERGLGPAEPAHWRQQLRTRGVRV